MPVLAKRPVQSAGECCLTSAVKLMRPLNSLFSGCRLAFQAIYQLLFGAAGADTQTASAVGHESDPAASLRSRARLLAEGSDCRR